MGNVSSIGPDGNRMILRRLVLLARQSHFDEEEVEVLFEKFNSLRVHPSQKVDPKVVSASPISCRSLLCAPEIGLNLFLQAVLCKYFSSPFRDFLLARDNRVQMSSVTVKLPPGPLGLHVHAGLRNIGLYIKDSSESLGYKEIQPGMQLIGINKLNVATLEYDRIVSVLEQHEDEERELHFQLVGHDVDEATNQRELKRIRSRRSAPRKRVKDIGNYENPQDSDSDWDESENILYAQVSAGPINAVLAPGEGGYCARVMSLKDLENGTLSEVQRAGVTGGMLLVGINNIHTNKLKFPEIVDVLRESSRQANRLLRFRDGRYFQLRKQLKAAETAKQPAVNNPLYRAPTQAEFEEELAAEKRQRQRVEQSTQNRTADYIRRKSSQNVLAGLRGSDELENIDLSADIRSVEVAPGPLGVRLVSRDTGPGVGVIVREYMSNDSPIKLAGVHIGAELLAINDTVVQSSAYTVVMDMLRAKASESKVLRFQQPKRVQPFPENREPSPTPSPAPLPQRDRDHERKETQALQSRRSSQKIMVTQDVDVDAGPLGMRLHPVDDQKGLGAKVVDFVEVPDPDHNGGRVKSPVQRAGVEIGMQLVRIDGKDVDTMQYQSIMDLLRTLSSKPKSLRFRTVEERDDREVKAFSEPTIRSDTSSIPRDPQTLLINVGRGSLGVRWQPTAGGATGAKVIDFEDDEGDESSGQSSSLKNMGVERGMTLVSIDGLNVTTMPFQDILGVLRQKEQQSKDLGFRRPDSSRRGAPPALDLPGQQSTRLLSPNTYQQVQSPTSLESDDDGPGSPEPVMWRNDSSRRSLGHRPSILEIAQLQLKAYETALEEDFSIWLFGIITNIDVFDTMKANELVNKRNLRMVLSKNILLFYELENKKRNAGKSGHRAVKMLKTRIPITRSCTVGGDLSEGFFTLVANEVVKPSSRNTTLSRARRMSLKNRFVDAKIPVQSSYELQNGTTAIAHEENEDHDFQLEFTPNTRRHCSKWVSRLEEVIQRVSRVHSSAINFKFNAKDLVPRDRWVTPAPNPSSPVLISTKTELGFVLVPDDLGRGALLSEYSSSAQLEQHGIELGSALIRINSLEVTHMDYDDVMVVLSHAISRTPLKPRALKKQITLEFCSLSDYYQFLCRDLFITITPAQLEQEVELGPDEHGNAAVIVSFKGEAGSADKSPTASSKSNLSPEKSTTGSGGDAGNVPSIDSLSTVEVVDTLNRDPGSAVLRRAGARVGMVIVALDAESLMDVSFDEAMLFITRSEYNGITLRHPFAHYSPSLRKAKDALKTSNSKDGQDAKEELGVPRKKIALAGRRRSTLVRRQSSTTALSRKPKLKFITVSEFTEGDIFHQLQLVARDPPTHIFEDSLHAAHPSYRHYSTRTTQKDHVSTSSRTTSSRPPQPPQKKITCYKGCIVHRVNDEHSTFALQGVKPGMELFEINGRDVTDLPFDDIVAQVFSVHYFTSSESSLSSVLRLKFRSIHYEDDMHEDEVHDTEQSFTKPMVKLVEFEEFIGLSSILSLMASPQEKAAFLARVIDEENDGYISYENAFAFLKALHGAHFCDDQLELATISFLNKCGVEEDIMYDGNSMPSRLTDREFSIWNIRQTTRNKRRGFYAGNLMDSDPASRSRLKVPRYVVERLFVDDANLQNRLLMLFDLKHD